MDRLAEYESRIKKGIYRHFKGNLYEVVGIARHSEDLRPMVVYRACRGDGALWVRDAQMWEEYVELEGKKQRRFELVSEETK